MKEIGSTAWGRTRDDAINSRALYQLSYREIKRNRSPLTAFTHPLVKIPVVMRLLAIPPGAAMPAGGGDEAAQQGANDVVKRFCRPPGDRCVSGCHGESP
jgi:hypothetical protein